MRRKYFVIPAASILIVLVFIIACAVNPVTGKKELMFFSEQDEIAMGKETDVQIRQEFGLYGDSRINAYITEVGQKLVPNTHRPKLPYHFAVLDTPVENAFAAPGGYIYITRGLLALMNSEAELSGVLGHELGHVSARHSLKRLSQTLLLYVGLAIGSALSKDIAKVAGFAGIGFQLLFLKFSRDDEYQADELGIIYARKAGYPGSDMVNFFRSIERISEMQGGFRLPNFLSTHPLNEKRIKRVTDLLQPQDFKLPNQKTAYLAQVNGLIFGENPRQGYVSGQAFYHPELGFSFDIPQGWQVRNTPQQVLLVSKDEKAAIQLEEETSGLDVDGFLAKKSQELKNLQFINKDYLNINGMNSVRALYNLVEEQQEPLKIQLTCIKKGAEMYTFAAMSANPNFNTYYSEFEQTIHSFRRLNDPQYLNRWPHRIYLISASGREKLQDMMRQANIDQKLWNYIAILNAMKPESVPSPQQTIKLVR